MKRRIVSINYKSSPTQSGHKSCKLGTIIGTSPIIEERGVVLETSSALKIEEAKIEGIEIEIPHEAYLGAFKISVPKEYGIVIPTGGAQRVYFKLRADKPKTTYEISGSLKSPITGDVLIRPKEFKYLCDAGMLPEAVKAELKP